LRRIIIALATAVLAVVALTAAQPASAVIDGRLHVKSATATTPGLTTGIQVVATADYAVTRMTATLHYPGQTDVIATVDGFELTSGTATDGVWRSAAVTVPEGRLIIDLQADNAAGGTFRYNGAGVIDNGRDLGFEDFGVGPTVIDVDHEEITFHGRVVTASDDGTPVGVPNQPVSFTEAVGPTTIGSTRTDDGGRFTATVRLSHPAPVYATVGPNATYREATSERVGIRFSPFPTRLTIKAPDESVIGRPITVTGRLERQNSAGDWLGLGDTYVHVGDDVGVNTQVSTGPDGSFTAEVVPHGPWTQWQAMFFALSDAGAGYQNSNASSSGVHAVWRSRVAGFNAAPEPVGVDAPVTATGQLLRTTAAGTEEAAPDALVAVEFSADGKKWTYQESERTDANGRFTLRTPAQQDGYWRAVARDPDYTATPGSADQVDVRYRTRVTSFNAAPEPVRKGKTITVSGSLQRYTSVWTAWRAFSGQSVKIYFQTKGTTTWTYKGSAKTTSSGHFAHGFTASKDGTWRATYAGGSSYLGVTGSGDFVDVR
jgi:hypothetical protein